MATQREIKATAKEFGITYEIAEQVEFTKHHVNTEAGYKAFYELEKIFKDNKNLSDGVMYDLSAWFAWDGRLENAVNRLAIEEGRYDLVSEEGFLPEPFEL